MRHLDHSLHKSYELIVNYSSLSLSRVSDDDLSIQTRFRQLVNDHKLLPTGK